MDGLRHRGAIVECPGRGKRRELAKGAGYRTMILGDRLHRHLQHCAVSKGKKWWAVRDLNPGPKDSDWCNFRYSLDYAFAMAICFRRVPSSLYTFKVFLPSLARRCHGL